MSNLLLRRLRDKIWPEPLPSANTFEGQIILITGGTTGLGLAAVRHFAALGATVIFTSRTLAKGEKVKEDVEKDLEIFGKGKVEVMELDMTSYESCVEFVERLRESEVGRRGIDVAVLNAGVINTEFIRSEEGWEETVQVNTLSTTLLGLLLLSWMKEYSPEHKRTPHLVFVTSRDHLDPSVTEWKDIAAHESLLHHFTDEKNWPLNDIQPNYANSKLLLTYAVEEIQKRAYGANGQLLVIVNSVCPGLVYTDLGRSIIKSSPLMKLLVPIHTGILGKSAYYGARFYLTAALTSKEGHGKYVQSLFTEEEYERLSYPNLRSEMGVEVQAIVWKEIYAELKRVVPDL